MSSNLIPETTVKDLTPMQLMIDQFKISNRPLTLHPVSIHLPSFSEDAVFAAYYLFHGKVLILVDRERKVKRMLSKDEAYKFIQLHLPKYSFHPHPIMFLLFAESYMHMDDTLWKINWRTPVTKQEKLNALDFTDDIIMQNSGSPKTYSMGMSSSAFGPISNTTNTYTTNV